MALFVFGIIILIIGIIAFTLNIQEIKGITKTTGIISFIIGIILIISSCMKSVPTGNTGVVTTFGKVENYVYEAGLHFDAPWRKVVNMDNRTQKQTISTSCSSKDIQVLTVVYTINYQIDKANAQNIYKTIGTDYFSTVMYPKVLDAVKAVVAKYNAESLVASRGTLASEIEAILKEDMASNNIQLVSTALEDITFSDAFKQAVEDKQIAEQNKLKAETQQEQALIEANAEAEKKRISAQADADAKLIAAQNDVEVQKLAADAAEYAGQKQAAINQRIADSLTPELNQYYLIEAWKEGASVPSTVLGETSITSMFDLTKE